MGNICPGAHEFVQKFLLRNKISFSEYPFLWSHVQQKYGNYTGLSEADLKNLFSRRWRYFRWKDLLISISFVDLQLIADKFLNDIVYGKEVRIVGKITDASGCYYVPRIIKVECGNIIHQVFTWLFLYNGAFKDGDVVEFAGRQCVIEGQEYIIVDALSHYVKIIHAVHNEVFPNIICRKAVQSDLLHIINFLSIPEIDNAFVLPLSQRSETIESRVLSRFSRGFWITLWDGNILCGCWSVSYDISQEKATFSTLAIKPSYQGKGLGKWLMRESIGLCIAEYNPKRMQFDSWHTNQAIKTLASQLGFVGVAEYDEPSKRPPGIKNVLYERVCRE